MTDELGNQVRSWILAQPQLTWDLGAMFGAANHLLIGIEYQYWRNKLGTDNHDNVCQLLVIWRLCRTNPMDFQAYQLATTIYDFRTRNPVKSRCPGGRP